MALAVAFTDLVARAVGRARDPRGEIPGDQGCNAGHDSYGREREREIFPGHIVPMSDSI